jgi:hypothetical protein
VTKGLLELREEGSRLRFQEGHMVFVSSQLHWDGTDLLFKSKGYVILQEGRPQGAISAFSEPHSFYASFPFVL